jgi:hypothetical protein
LSEFDPIRAQREELAHLTEAVKQMTVIARQKDAEVDEATTTRDALLKAAGLMKGLIESGRARLLALENEAERKASTP